MRRAAVNFGAIREAAGAQLGLVQRVDVREEIAFAEVLQVGAAQPGRIDALEAERLDRAANGLAKADLIGQRANLGRQSIAVAEADFVDGLVEAGTQVEGVGDAQAVAHDVMSDQLIGQLARVGRLETDPAAARQREGAQQLASFRCVVAHEELAGSALAMRELVECDQEL